MMFLFIITGHFDVGQTSFTNSSFNFLDKISACLLATNFVQSLNNEKIMHGSMKMMPWTRLRSK